MRRKRQLIPQEFHWVREMVSELCLANGLNPHNAEYMSVGLLAFCEVYCTSPIIFGEDLWMQAYGRIDTALKQAKREEGRCYWQKSLSAPAFQDSSTPRVERMPKKTGDFTESIALWDYVGRLPADSSRLAYQLANRCDMAEAAENLGWGQEKVRQTMEELRAAFMEYEKIA